MAKIIWEDLPKRYGLFTKRSAKLISLSNGATIQHYNANTKINVVQCAMIDGVKYFRTESAAIQDLDRVFRADVFELPPELASLEPFENSLSNNSSRVLAEPKPKDKKPPKMKKLPESEGGVSEERKSSILLAFKRFFKRKQ